jgi:hypothetical protein
MGHRSTISGHIQEAWYVAGTGYSDCPTLNKLRELNDAAIGSLPAGVEFPELARELFAASGWIASNTYRGRAFHFGGSFHTLWVDGEGDEWLKSFEALLRQMYWEYAHIEVVTEFVGTHHYRWEPTEASKLRFSEDPPLPANDWTRTCFESSRGVPTLPKKEPG